MKLKKRAITPIIKVKLQINEAVQIFGIYDSGPNVLLINPELIKINKTDNKFKYTNLVTIISVQTSGLDFTKEFKLTKDGKLSKAQELL